MINVNPANPLQFENMLCTEFFGAEALTKIRKPLDRPSIFNIVNR